MSVLERIYGDEIQEEYTKLLHDKMFEQLVWTNDLHELLSELAAATVMNKLLIKSIQYINE